MIVEDLTANMRWLPQDFKRNGIDRRNITSARHPKEMHSCCKNMACGHEGQEIKRSIELSRNIARYVPAVNQVMQLKQGSTLLTAFILVQPVEYHLRIMKNCVAIECPLV